MNKEQVEAKREEVRNCIVDKGLVALCAGQGDSVYYNIADRIIKELSSLGVMLVDKEAELPSCAFYEYKIEMAGSCPLLKAGYQLTYPLVEVKE